MLGRFDDALREYERAIEIKPDFPEALYNLVNTLLKIGKVKEATQRYRQALILQPNDANTVENLGQALRILGEHDEAINYLRRALQIRPSVQTSFNLVMALLETNRSDEAIATVESAIRWARANGQTADAEQMEAWLRAYRSQNSSGVP
jgi:superkiller protein 3